MAQSTTNLFTLMNECLRECGERPFEVDDDETNTRILIRQCIKSALHDFAREGNWLFLREFRTAVSWTFERANIGQYHRLYQVQQRGQGLVYVPEISIEDFYNVSVLPYAISNSIPSYFAIINEAEIAVHPYPTTILDRNNLLFLVQGNLTMPVIDIGLFNMPEEMLSVFKLKVCMHIALKHLNSRETVQNFAGTYGTALRDALNTDNSRSPNFANMFKGGVRGTRYR